VFGGEITKGRVVMYAKRLASVSQLLATAGGNTLGEKEAVLKAWDEARLAGHERKNLGFSQPQKKRVLSTTKKTSGSLNFFQPLCFHKFLTAPQKVMSRAKQCGRRGGWGAVRRACWTGREGGGAVAWERLPRAAWLVALAARKSEEMEPNALPMRGGRAES
jgi:hypothetical protein